MKLKCLIILLSFFVHSGLSAQDELLSTPAFSFDLPNIHFLNSSISDSPFQLNSLFERQNLPAQKHPDFLGMAYRYQDLALFCKLDVQLEKTARFPVKFRLGEVQYVDRMEGKY